jgi:hypothetical protein
VAGSFTATTTSLCLIAAPGTTCTTPPAAVTVTHGAQVNVSVKVMNGPNPIAVSNSATKAEVVSLIGTGGNLPGGTAGVDVLTANTNLSSGVTTVSNDDIEPLTSGLASFNTDFLLGGTSYSVSAYYPGDGTFGASTSSGIPVTVNAEPSRTSVTAGLLNFLNSTITNISAATVFYGDAITLRADVVGSVSGQENGTGSVTFTDNGTGIGTFRLNTEGYSEDQSGSNVDGVSNVAALPVGAHSISATYSGDNSYCPTVGTCGTGTSTAPTPVAFTVIAAPTTTSVVAGTSSISPATNITVASGTSVTLTAGVDTFSGSASSSGGSSGAFLTGTVTFTCSPAVTGCSTAATVTSNASTFDGDDFVAGVASVTIAPTATTTVTATFTPSGVDGADYTTSATTVSATITVNSATSFTLAPLPSPITTLTITAPGGSANTAVTVTSSGLTGNVTLTCAVAPVTAMTIVDLPTCSYTLSGTANNVVALTGSGSSGARTLVINTTAPTTSLAPLRRPQDGPDERLLLAVGASLLVILGAAFAFAGVSANRLLRTAILASMVVLFAVGVISCSKSGSSSNGSSGSPGSGGGTTVTNYNVTVTATPSTGSAVTTAVQVNVN